MLIDRWLTKDTVLYSLAAWTWLPPVSVPWTALAVFRPCAFGNLGQRTHLPAASPGVQHRGQRPASNSDASENAGCGGIRLGRNEVMSKYRRGAVLTPSELCIFKTGRGGEVGVGGSEEAHNHLSHKCGMIGATSPLFFFFLFFFSFTFEGSRASRRVLGISCSPLLSNCWKSEPIRSHDRTGGWDLERGEKGTAFRLAPPYCILSRITFFSQHFTPARWVPFQWRSFCLLNCPPFFVFSCFCWCLNLSVWHCWFWSRFYPLTTHPGFKFLACSYSDREYRRRMTGLTCLPVLFRGSSGFCLNLGNFSPNVYWWFWHIFIFFVPLFVFCRLLLLLCFGLPFAVLCVAFQFCDFDVSVALTNQTFAFTLFSSFHYQKESFLKLKTHVLMWYFSCSWSHRFVVFFLFYVFPRFFHYAFASDTVKYFWMISFFTRWCWVHEGSFDSFGSSMRFLFTVWTRMNRHFPSRRYI